MIRVGDHRANSVKASGKTSWDGSEDLTVRVEWGVDSQEEGEYRGIGRGGGIEGTAEILNGDVSVTDDETFVVEEGGCAVVGEFGVCEESEVHALLGDGDGEVCVCGEIFVVAGEDDERGWHVGLGRNESLVKLDHDIKRCIPMEYHCKNH